MSEKREERWQAYDTTPGGGTAGWAFIRQLEGAFDFHGYVFGIANREDARKLKAHLNALEQERDELRKKWNNFMEWLTDQQIVHWTLTKETKDNPKAAVESLLQTFLQEINDPRISQVAAKAALADEAGRIVKELRRMATHHQQDDLVRQLRNDWWYRYAAISEVS